MAIEQRLHSTLTGAAERIEVQGLEVGAVVRRAERRSSRKRIATSVVGLAVLLAAVLGVTQLAGIGTPDLDVLGAPEGSRPAAVFLCDGQQCPEISDETRDLLRAELERDPDVLRVAFESEQDAYRRFREVFADQPDLIRSVSPDALPSSFRVLLSAGADADTFSARYRSREGVEDVVLIAENDPAFEGTQPPGRPATSAR